MKKAAPIIGLGKKRVQWLILPRVVLMSTASNFGFGCLPHLNYLRFSPKVRHVTFFQKSNLFGDQHG
jgi:hypothetical protein